MNEGLLMGVKHTVAVAGQGSEFLKTRSAKNGRSFSSSVAAAGGAAIGFLVAGPAGAGVLASAGAVAGGFLYDVGLSIRSAITGEKFY